MTLIPKIDATTQLMGMVPVENLPPMISSTHAESLTDGLGNFIFANGDLVYVTGVPN